jgi:hypothetical protein
MQMMSLIILLHSLPFNLSIKANSFDTLANKMIQQLKLKVSQKQGGQKKKGVAC